MNCKIAVLLPVVLILSCAAANRDNGTAAQSALRTEPAVHSSSAASPTAALQPTSSQKAIPINDKESPAVAQLFKGNNSAQIENGLGVGDSISITAWGHPDISGVARIEKDGKIYLPLVGGIEAQGLTLDQLKDKITTAYRAYIRHPLLEISVLEYASRMILVLGSVAKPGIYPVKGGTDIVTAIALAGGQMVQAGQSNLSSVYLIRKGHSTIVNVYDYLQNGHQYNDPLLENKDVVYVPSSQDLNIIVLGYVEKPAIIPVTGPSVNIVQAIVLAGGFRLGALKNDVKVIRGGLIHPDIYTVPVDKLLHGEQPQSNKGIELYAGDIIYVPKTALASWNEILNQIEPTMNILLAQPLSIATNYLLLRQLLRQP